MIRVIYVSSTPEKLTRGEVADLLHVSRQNNDGRGITGLLVYEGGNFMQVLEGPEAEVGDLLAVIAADSRHGQMIELLRDEIDERYFPGWAMAYGDLSALDGDQRAEASDFLAGGALPEPSDVKARRVRTLLQAFRDMVQPYG